MVRPSRPLLAILLVAALLRLAIVVASLDRPLGGDAYGYDLIARNVAAGSGLSWGSGDEPRTPTAVRGPGYVLFLAGLERLFGHHRAVIYGAQVLLDLGSCLLVWAIARRTFEAPAVALGAALLYAVYVPFALAAASVLTETFINFTVLATLLLFLRFVADRRWRDLVAAAGVLGVAVLAKSHLILLLPVLVVAALPELGWRRAARALLLGGAVLALFVIPWILRNERVFGEFVPGTTHGGITFWGGTGPNGGRTLGGAQDPGTPPHVPPAIAGLGEVEKDRWFYAEGRRVIRQHPVRSAGVFARKIPRLWFNLGFDDPPSAASLAVAAFNLGLILLALKGLRERARRSDPARILLALVLYFTLIHLPFAAVLRYALPVYAFLLVFAAAGLVSLMPRRGPRPIAA